jgi:hypothetical protein
MAVSRLSGVRLFTRVLPDVDIAGGGNLKAGNHTQDGGLAAAGRSQQRYKLTGIDGQVYVFTATTCLPLMP